jgi:transposase
LSQGKKPKAERSLFVLPDEINRHIPKTHFYRQLDSLMDLSFVYELTRPLYAVTMGRPSLDPVVFFKCMMVGFFENIVEDTVLEFRIADSLILREFIGYSLEERTPDESTLRKTRQKVPEEAFRRVFSYVQDVCQENGLLKGRAAGTDSTPVDANASMDSLRHKELGCTYEEYMMALRHQDDPSATKSEAMEADKKRSGKASNRDWESATDPEARVIQHPDGHTHLSYKVDATMDLETGVILSAGASPADVSDQTDFIERVDEVVESMQERGLNVEVVVADKGHHSGENLTAMEEREPVALISSPKSSRGKPGFRREDFTYDEEKDQLVCPAGQILNRRKRDDSPSRYYQASGRVCQSCEHWGACTKNKNGRSVSISPYEGLIVENRERVRSEAARPLMQIRRQRGEAPFGYFKMFGGLRRFAGRGLEYAQKKTLIAALCWNLLLLVKKVMRERQVNAAFVGVSRLFFVLISCLQALLAALLHEKDGRTESSYKMLSLRPSLS